MSYTEILRKSRQKEQVAFNEFMLSVRAFPEHLFCFFEGNDNDYYIPRIKQFTPHYLPIKTGGREKVLAVHQLIANREEYHSYKKAFFIDRDFNPPLTPKQPPIFETACYSIENLYVSKAVFKEILSNSFGLSQVSDTAFQTCVDLFEARQEEFHEAVKLFNAWYACLMDMRNEQGIKMKVQLKDNLPTNFVNFSLTGVTANYDLDTIKQSFPQAPEVSQEALQAKLLEFSNCEAHKVFRGKYEMQFLIQMIRLLWQDAKNEHRFLTEKIHFAFGDGSSLNHVKTINIFSAYAETPENLLQYLEKVVVVNR